MHSSQANVSHPSATPKVRVLSVGTLPELLSLRQAVLEGAGFEVFTTTNDKHALLRIENSDCAVLLLCYSVEDRVREQLIKRFREKCPTGRIVALTNSPIATPPADVDSLVFGVEGAEALINAVRGKIPIG